MPAHCTAVGKALLAFSDEVTQPLELERRTTKTIVDPTDLQIELGEIRREGLAYDREESLKGLVCVAAPVLAPKGRGVAAISVSMPLQDEARPEDFTSAVRMAALALGRELSNRAGFV
jgi:DNA-binding IclR family transcriptional regulator